MVKIKSIRFNKKFLYKDRLVTEASWNKDATVLPSPEDLKYKVLIRVNRKKFFFTHQFFFLRAKLQNPMQ